MKMDTRKEIKQKYKETPRLMGVYQIINTMNGKVLVGRSMNLEGSRNSYHYQLDFKRHHYQDLQEDLSKYGIEAFQFEILETIDPKDYSKDEWPFAVEVLEEKWLEKIQPYDDQGYHRKRKE